MLCFLRFFLLREHQKAQSAFLPSFFVTTFALRVERFYSQRLSIAPATLLYSGVDTSAACLLRVCAGVLLLLCGVVL